MPPNAWPRYWQDAAFSTVYNWKSPGSGAPLGRRSLALLRTRAPSGSHPCRRRKVSSIADHTSMSSTSWETSPHLLTSATPVSTRTSPATRPRRPRSRPCVPSPAALTLPAQRGEGCSVVRRRPPVAPGSTSMEGSAWGKPTCSRHYGKSVEGPKTSGPLWNTPTSSGCWAFDERSKS